MHKIIVTWFEIVSEDLEKASHFYENIFQVKLDNIVTPTGIKMSIFPGYKGKHYGAMGALISGKDLRSGNNSTTVYFESKDINTILLRVPKFGGTILLPKTNIGENGYVAHFTDLDNNKVGLHSLE